MPRKDASSLVKDVTANGYETIRCQREEEGVGISTYTHEDNDVEWNMEMGFTGVGDKVDD